MRLSEYIKLTKKRIAYLALDIGVSSSTVYRILRGLFPSLKEAMKIEYYTKGMVTCRDIYEEVEGMLKSKQCESNDSSQKNSKKEGINANNK